MDKKAAENKPNRGGDALDAARVIRLVAAALLLALGMALPVPEPWKGLFTPAAALVGGFDVIKPAIVQLVRNRVISGELMLALACALAFALGAGLEGAAAVLLYNAGGLLRDFVLSRARRAVTQRIDARVMTATLLEGGHEKTVASETLKIGDIILIRPNERAPVDCVVVRGKSALDLSGVTGDNRLLLVEEEDFIPSGAVNARGNLIVEAAASFENSTAARVMAMFTRGPAEDGETIARARDISKIFILACSTLAVAGTLLLVFAAGLPFAEGARRMLVFLVTAGPWAIFVPVGLAYFTGLGGAVSRGILFRGPAAADRTARTGAVVFETGGVITNGELVVTAVKPERMDADTMLSVAAHAEAYSEHPIAEAIKRAHKGSIYLELIETFVEYPGAGVTVLVDGKEISIGTRAFLNTKGVDVRGDDFGMDTAVFMSIAGVYAGRIVLTDSIRPGVSEAARDLTGEGIRVAMVSGGNAAIVSGLARAVGIKEYYAGCAPDSKAERVREIKQAVGIQNTVMFVGTGAANAAVLSAADVPVVTGGLSGSSVGEADVIIMDCDPEKTVEACLLARRARRVAWQGVALTLALKAVILTLGALGLANALVAVAADTLVSLAAIVFAGRAFAGEGKVPKP